jgi:hypothetical protein
LSEWGQFDPFRSYLRAHYAPVQTFENLDVVWQRKEALSNRTPSE